MRRNLFLLIFLFFISASFAQLKSGDLVPYKKGKLFGYSDVNKKMIIPARFEDARPFTEGLAPVRQNNLWGFIDSTGNFIISPQYTYVDNFVEGRAAVELNKLKGLIDKKGKEFIPARYADIEDCDKAGYYIAEDSTGMSYLYDAAGKNIYKANKIIEMGPFCEVEIAKIVIEENDTDEVDYKGLIYTATGKEVVPVKYDEIDMAIKVMGLDSARVNKLQRMFYDEKDWVTGNEDLVYFKTGDNKRNHGVFSLKKGEIVPCRYKKFDMDDLMETGYAIAEDDKYQYVIDLNGKMKSDVKAEEISGKPGKEWLTYEVNGKEGLMDEHGAVLTNPIFKRIDTKEKTAIGEFETGKVLLTGKSKAKDASAFTLCSEINSLYSLSVYGIATIKLGDNYGAIDKKGKIIVKPVYERVNCNKDFILLRNNGKYGLADVNGKIKLECEFDNVICPADKQLNSFVVIKNKELGIIKDGKFSSCVKIPEESFVDYFTDFESGNEKYVWVNWDDKLGPLKISGDKVEMLSPFKYLIVGEFMDNNIVMQDSASKLIGVLDKTGKIIVPFKYDLIEDGTSASYEAAGGAFFACSSGGTVDLYNHAGKLLRSENDTYSGITSADLQDFNPCGVSMKKGSVFFDTVTKNFFPWKSLELVETPTEPASNIMVMDSTRKYALMDKKGKILSPFIFTSIENGLYDNKNKRTVIIFKDENQKKGLCTLEGKILCPAQYESLDVDDSYSTLNASRNEKRGIVNLEGKEVVPCSYDAVENLYADVFSVTSEKGFTMIYDKEGNILLPDGKVRKIDYLWSRGKIGGRNFIYVSIVAGDDNINCFVDDKGNMFYEE